MLSLNFCLVLLSGIYVCVLTSLPGGVRYYAMILLSLVHCILLISLPCGSLCCILFMYFFVSFLVLQSSLRQLLLCSYVNVYILLDVVLVSCYLVPRVWSAVKCTAHIALRESYQWKEEKLYG